MSQTNDLSLELEGVINQLSRSKFFQHNHGPLRAAETRVLFLISKLKQGEPVTPSEIASKIGVTLSAVTHQINSLENEGLINRVQDTNDRRVVEITLSAKGQEEIKAIKKILRKKIKILTDYLGEKDTKDLVRVFKRISELLEHLEQDRNA